MTNRWITPIVATHVAPVVRQKSSSKTDRNHTTNGTSAPIRISIACVK